MKRTLAIFAPVCLLALLVALGGVYLVCRDRSRICTVIQGEPPCTCGCRDAHVRANNEVTARTEHMALEAGIAILVLLAILLGGTTVLFALDARRARRQSAANRDFVAEVSHQLRTPLTGICLNADLLNEDRLHGAEERREAISSIAEGSKKLVVLVEKLLDHVAQS